MMRAMKHPGLRRLSDDELKEMLAALSRLGIFVKDFHRDSHVPNTFWLQWGYSEEDMRGDRWLEVIHPDDREQVRARFAQHESGIDEISQSEYRIVTRSGEVRWILSKSILFGEKQDGIARHMVGIDYDVTDMVEAREEIARSRAEAEERAREAEMLRRAGAAIASTLDRREAVARVLEFLAAAVPYHTATVQALDGEFLEVLDASGPVDRSCSPGAVHHVERHVNYRRVVRTREAELITCPMDEIPELPRSVDGESASWMGVPLVTRGRVLGLLTLAAERCDVFDSEHLRLTTAVADYVALAIQNARLYEETRQAAIRDPLTGAYTRYWFVPYAERQIDLARRDSSPLSLVVFDLDHFKKLNDTFGHPAGDEVLAGIVEAVSASLRSGNPVCRLGGEEFGVLLPGVPPERAVGVAERMCRAAARRTHDCCENGRVTISAGVGWLNDHCSSYEDLVAAADRAMYESKRAGRNRVTLHTPRETA